MRDLPRLRVGLKWLRHLEIPRGRSLFGKALAVGAVFALAYIAPGGTARGADTLDDRREQVEKLPADKKEQLEEKLQRFLALSAAQQQQLRDLDMELNDDPQGAALRRTLQRYHEWLKTLSPSDRTELLDMPADKRLARIKELKQQQQEEQQRQLARYSTHRKWGSPVDGWVLIRWAHDYVRQHEDELLKKLPPNRAEEFKNDPANKKDDLRRTRALLVIAVTAWRSDDPNSAAVIPDADLKILRGRLSDATGKLLDAAATGQAKAKLIGDWLSAAAQNEMAFRFGRGRPSSPEFLKKLEKFEQEELTDADRERLKEAPADQRQRKLRELYFESHPPPDGPPLRPNRRPPAAATPPNDAPPALPEK